MYLQLPLGGGALDSGYLIYSEEDKTSHLSLEINKMAFGRNTLVSSTWMTEGSAVSPGVDSSPPSTNTLESTEAIVCPDLIVGAGPMFWNMYHLWSKKSLGGKRA